jgi:hypothetical protein
MARPLSILIGGNQLPVAMWARPWQASAQFTFFTWSGTTSGTTNSEYVFGADCLHVRSDHAANPAEALVNIDLS